MRYEKIIKRPDKSYVKIEVNLIIKNWPSSVEWHVFIYKKKYRHKLWEYIKHTSFQNYDELHEKHKKQISKDEIHEAKLELWKKIQPKYC